jgi:nitrogenase molybdenum-iron protein alpha chain
VFTDMVGLDDTEPTGKYNINILGEYNIGGDAWEIHRICDMVGINLVSVLSGSVSYDEIANCHMADLNVVMCHRSINYMAEMMETKYGLPVVQGQLHRCGVHG